MRNVTLDLYTRECCPLNLKKKSLNNIYTFSSVTKNIVFLLFINGFISILCVEIFNFVKIKNV